MGPSEVLGFKAEDNFRLFVDAVLDYAVFALSPQGIVMSWNKGAQRLKGYTAPEIIGKHFSVFYLPEDIARNHPQEELVKAAESGRYEEEGWRVRKDGTRFWANVIITAVRDASGRLLGFAKVTRDLTERKLAEELLEKKVVERTRELIEANEKLEYLTEHLRAAAVMREEFLSVTSHELKTPLTAIKLQLQLRNRLLSKPDFGGFSREKIIKMAKDDERQIDRLSRLVDDMLDITRITSGKLQLNRENMNLTHVIQEVLDRFALQLQTQGYEIQAHLEEGVIGTWDSYRIEQVFINLLTNAMKYGEQRVIRIDLRQEDGNAIFSVQDEGMGISPSDQKRVFERFERAISSESISGIGLGLYIAQQIVEAHSGTIHLESDLGKGSIFTVKIPLDQRESSSGSTGVGE